MFTYKIFARILFILVFAGMMTTCAIAQKGKKPPLEDKGSGGSVSHTINTGGGQNNQQNKPNTGSVVHEVKPEKYNPPLVYIPPVENRSNDNNNASQQNAGPVVPIIVTPTQNTRNEQKPILVITHPENKNIERPDRKPSYREGRYYYSTRPNFSPSYYGFWAFDNEPDVCRSAYFHYGYLPYVDRMRIHVVHYDPIDFNTKYINSDSDEYYLGGRVNNELDYTLSDIRKSWLDGRSDLIGIHVRKDQMIAVLLDGDYDYSLESDDYTQMTFDAIDQTRTSRFTWESIRQRANGDYTAFAKHTYLDSSNDEQVVYVSYTLRKVGRNYHIVEVGSSKQPLN